MDIQKAIQIYLDKKNIDWLNDVKLQDDGKGAYIKEWNITDKEKPSVELLRGLWDSEGSKFLAEEKLRAKIKWAKPLIEKASATTLGEHWKIHLLRYIKEYWKEIKELEIDGN